jgi:O-antigen/teichoic acid export membrane protein
MSNLSLSTLADHYCPSIFRPILNRVQQSPIGKRIVSGTFWSVVGNGFGKLFTFIAMVLVARILGKETFGDFGLVQSTAVTFVTFSGFGLGVTATKYIAELVHTDKLRTGRIIGLNYLFTFFSSAIVAIIFYFSVPWICEANIGAVHLINEIRWVALLLFLMTFMSIQLGIMSGFQDFKGQATATFIVGVLSIPAYIIGTKLGNLHGAVLGLLVVTAINVLINSIFIFQNTRKLGIRYSFWDAYKELPILWKFSFPTMLCTIVYSGIFWVCQMMLRATPNGDAELGIFFAGLSIWSILMFIPMKLCSVMLSMLSEFHGMNNHRRFRKTVTLHFLINIFVVGIFVIPVAIFSKQIMTLFGDDFANGYGTLLLLCLFAGLYIIGNNVDQIVLSQGKAWLAFVYCVLGSIVTITTCYYLITTNWGSLGLTLAMVAGHLTRMIFWIGFGLIKLKKLLINIEIHYDFT